MTQDFAAPVIEQPDIPQKLKKHFCFATIPFIFIALFNLYSCIHRIFILVESFDVGNILYFVGDLFYFVGAVFITVLLFAKVYNALLGVPLFMFSAGYMMKLGAQFAWAFKGYYESFADGLLNRLHWMLMLLSASLAFLIVTVYIFIVTSRKKSAPKVLWIIPAVLFCLFFAPWGIYMLIEFVDNLIHFYTGFIQWIPTYFIEPLFPVAIILLLIWISFPYKKNKVKKAKEVQPVPAAAPVMPAVQPSVQPEIKPAVQSATEPVVEKKPVDDDPERTIDYSYAEVFYPPVKAPETKPEAAAEPEVKAEVESDPKPAVQPAVNNDAETQRTNMQLLKEYKELLDGGVITQEDYDKKKNELLGL